MAARTCWYIQHEIIQQCVFKVRDHMYIEQTVYIFYFYLTQQWAWCRITGQSWILHNESRWADSVQSTFHVTYSEMKCFLYPLLGEHTVRPLSAKITVSGEGRRRVCYVHVRLCSHVHASVYILMLNSESNPRPYSARVCLSHVSTVQKRQQGRWGGVFFKDRGTSPRRPD